MIRYISFGSHVKGLRISDDSRFIVIIPDSPKPESRSLSRYPALKIDSFECSWKLYAKIRETERQENTNVRIYYSYVNK